MKKKMGQNHLKKLRENLKKLNHPEDHFLNIPQKVRKKLVIALQQIEVKKLAIDLGQETSVLKEWIRQLHQVEKILSQIALTETDRKNGKQWQWTPLKVRKEILTLCEKVSVAELAEVFHLNVATIYYWKKKALPSKCATTSIVAQPKKEVSSILTSKDGVELKTLIQRHQGKVRRKYSKSEKQLILALVDRFGSKMVYETFKVSYDTIARLQRKSVMEKAYIPRTPIRYAPVLEIMDKYPGMGPMQVRDYINRHLGKSMGVNSVRKVMEDHGWVPPYAKKIRVNEDIRRFEAVRRNYMWHLDFKHHYINKIKAYLLFVEDDYSRFIVGSTFGDGEKMEIVIGLIEECISIHGKPEMMMYDGGTAFHSWKGMSAFARYLEDYGIDRYVVKSANVNGKVESLNQKVENELLSTTTFASLSHLQVELAKWVGIYNFRRVHQGLPSLQIPADRYFPGAAKWYQDFSETTKQQSLVAETFVAMLNEIQKK